MRASLICLLVVALFGFSQAHLRLAEPTPRDVYNGKATYQQNEPVDAATSAFVCRNEEAHDPETTLTAGQTTRFRMDGGILHVGDCALYLSYSPLSTPDVEKKWFKIANWARCNENPTKDITMPSWLPSCEHCILRFEQYSLHVFPRIEFYAQCVDVRIVGVENGPLPADSQQVRIPGHMPLNGNNGEYRDPYNGGGDFMTGPAVASAPSGGAPASTTSRPASSTSGAAATSGSSSSTGSGSNCECPSNDMPIKCAEVEECLLVCGTNKVAKCGCNEKGMKIIECNTSSVSLDDDDDGEEETSENSAATTGSTTLIIALAAAVAQLM